MTRVDIIDGAITGSRDGTWHLEIFEERLPLREVIRRRVFQEVAEHHARPRAPFRGLVPPTDDERRLNGPPAGREHRRVDPEEQFVRAVAAFARNAFIVLVDDRQVDDLDAEIELQAGTEITFLRLVPLVGG